MLQRQNVPATKRLGTKTSGHQNINTKKLKILVRKMPSPTQQRKHFEIKFILATKISIIKCFHAKVSGGTNCFVIGHSPVLLKLVKYIGWKT